ncbi:uncharacterized protein [Typha latifolia]|uniref:uncharacterized protein n=1 Tax=Typha latifolia TaxID=4733 RepID=UPI003C2EA06A
MAGRLTLIKATMLAIPAYWMGSTWLPDSVLEAIPKKARAFLWENGSRRGMHLIGWDTATRPKEEGGLAIQKLTQARTALAGKLLFQVLNSWEGWQALWQLPLAPRVHLFIWKLCWGILPTRAYLHGLRIGPDEKCALCGIHPETIDHLFFSCRYALEVWALLAQDQDWTPTKVSHVRANWLCDDAQDTAFKALIAATLWTVWKQRNARVFRGENDTAKTVVRRAVQLARDYAKPTQQMLKPTRLRKECRWVAPPPGWIKVNVDGAHSPGDY